MVNELIQDTIVYEFDFLGFLSIHDLSLLLTIPKILSIFL